jgi:hypothetical protein
MDFFNLDSVACSGEYSNITTGLIKGGTFLRDTFSFKNNYQLSTFK